MCIRKQACDFCKQQAKYSGVTTIGSKAYMCEDHFKQYGLNIDGLFSVLEEATESTKLCSCCFEEKPISEFYPYKDGRGVSRYRTECKACNLANRKASSMRKARKLAHV